LENKGDSLILYYCKQLIYDLRKRETEERREEYRKMFQKQKKNERKQGEKDF
jgi:hypothetical protein